MIPYNLPAGFYNTGNFSVERHFPKADTANSELSHKRARASADPATVMFSYTVFRRFLCFNNHR